MILQSFERLAAYTATHIRYTAAPVAEILTNAAREAEFEPIRPFLHRFSPQEDWRAGFRDGVERELVGQGLTAADRALIIGWGEGLGSTDVTGQLEHCRQFGERLAAQAAGARQQAAVKGRLYTSLGVAGGLVATLLWL